LQLINAEGQSRYEKVSEASKRLKQLAKEINITVVALAQLRREDKSNVKPTLSDLKESGQIEQDADVVLFPYRPQYYSDHREDVEMDAELLIQKNRHGQCAAIPCSFEGKFTRYRELL
jgi:replicative DNA helicase